MKAIGLLLFFFCACLFTTSARAEGGAPKYAASTLRLYSHHEYIRKNPAPDFWALVGYYQPQESGRHCSVASAAMVLNGLRASANLTAADELITQKALLDKVKVLDWKAKVGEGGRGVTLEELKILMTEALSLHGMSGTSSVTVEAIHVDQIDAKTRIKIHDILVKNEKSAKDFIIANFLQSEYTGDPEGKVGHLSPVAGYDSKEKRVLIFDSDRQYYEPYWVSEEVFLKGMNTRDKGSDAFRGLLWIRLP
jgi:hypothetical protein